MNDEKPFKVLLVEGDADEAAVIERLLRDSADVGDAPARFELSQAPRLTTATHLLAREQFDAVLLDIVLPRSVGLEAFHKIRAQCPALPIVVLTGLRDRELAEEAVRRGAQDFVVRGSLGACMLRRVLRHAAERQRLACEVERLRRLSASTADGDARDRFMSKVSHELRNTVTTVKAAVYCLSDGLPDPLTAKQRQLVQMIARNVDRQVKTMDNILDLSRLRSGKQRVEPQPVDLGELARELAREAALRGAPRPLELDLDCRLPQAHGDPDLLAQALRQLLDNAFRYAAGKVVLKAQPDGAEAVIVSVVDDGPGVPAERMEDLFGDFVKFEKSNPAQPRGGGLGLAICREIARAHGGQVWAENGEPGARFHLRLPRARRAEAEAPAPRRKQPAPVLSQPLQQ